MADLCGLCHFSMGKHFVLTKEISAKGFRKSQPIGWLCPEPGDPYDPTPVTITVTGSGSGGGTASVGGMTSGGGGGGGKSYPGTAGGSTGPISRPEHPRS